MVSTREAVYQLGLENGEKSKKERNFKREVAKMFFKNIMFGKVIVRNEVPQV